MAELSDTELLVAEQYCHGLTDKEVADALGKPVWTIRTHKKHIYSKLSISTTHELVLYMVARENKVDWSVRELRRRGLAAVLAVLTIVYTLFATGPCMARSPRRARFEPIERRVEW